MRNTLVIVGLLALAGCATIATPMDVDGSRADGVITMAVTAGTSAAIDWNAAHVTARQRCRAWGYQDVEAFGGYRELCEAEGLFGCARARYERQYQCIDVLPDDE